jgi:hypothetical protein
LGGGSGGGGVLGGLGGGTLGGLGGGIGGGGGGGGAEVHGSLIDVHNLNALNLALQNALQGAQVCINLHSFYFHINSTLFN